MNVFTPSSVEALIAAPMTRPTVPVAPDTGAPVVWPPDQLWVTRPTLPPFDEFVETLRGIWERSQLTNGGPLVVELERQLAAYLGVKHCFFVTNGTIALQLAARAMELSGEVITTPYSYVATTSAMAWEGCTPVFADIEPDTLALSPEAAEAAITPRTSAIVATHVYGNPCDVDAFAGIARRHGVRILYDAAHSFGARFRGRPLAAYGDVATLSFHATKLFHTIEGGAVVTDDDEIARRVSSLRNFGHAGYEAFGGIGINGKNSEVHAAMGLCLLPRVEAIVAERAALARRYDAHFAGDERIVRPAIRAGTAYNHAYYALLLPGDATVRHVKAALERQGVNPRRYFYPSLNALPYVRRAHTPVAEDASRRAMCLPFFTGMTAAQVDRVAGLVLEALADSPAE